MKLIATMMVILSLYSGCVAGGNRPTGQAAIKHFETRKIDAPFDTVYEASVEAMFDLGYTISHSDKESGVIVGEKRKKKPFSEILWMSDRTKHRHDLYDTLQLTLLVRPKGKNASKVRIKTDVNKQRRLNRKAINEVWVYIDRQVMMEHQPS